MHLTPREIEKVLLYSLADVALKRKAKGLKLNHPESMAVICATAMDGAREGKTLEEVMKTAAEVLTRGCDGRRAGNDSLRPVGSGFYRWQSVNYRARSGEIAGC